VKRLRKYRIFIFVLHRVNAFSAIKDPFRKASLCFLVRERLSRSSEAMRFKTSFFITPFSFCSLVLGILESGTSSRYLLWDLSATLGALLPRHVDKAANAP
jgi:hypothetical protein